MKKKLLLTICALLIACFTFGLVACGEEPVNYTVSFDSAGGSRVTAQTVVEGGKVRQPDDPYFRGCTFLGWYLGGELWDFENNVVQNDITLKAKWEQIETEGLAFKDLTSTTCSVSIGDAIYDDVIVIPAEHNGKTVVEIEDDGFTEGRILSVVIMPDTITRIGDRAFGGLAELDDVEIPAKVTSIGADAFNGCVELCDFRLKLGTALERIEDRAFYGCRKLNSIVLPETVTYIGEDAFFNCLALTKINYLGTLDAWIDMGFKTEYSNPTRYAKNLYIKSKVVSSVDFGTRTEIPAFAFINCENLAKITINSTVMAVGEKAFRGCKGLKEIVYAEGCTLKTIKQSAFSNCLSLETMYIPASVTDIQESAFEGCANLKGVIFFKNSTITEIKANTFKNCRSLEYIVLPVSITTFAQGSLDNCSSLTRAYYYGNETEWQNVNLDLAGGYEGELEEGQEEEEPPIILVKDMIVPYYYSATEEEGKWHFEEDLPKVWGEIDESDEETV